MEVIKSRATENFEKSIIVISELFTKLVDIYQHKFNKDLLLLLAPNVDLIKINLFKKIILETIKNPKNMHTVYNDFFDEFFKIQSSNNQQEIICLLLKKYWIQIVNKASTIEYRDQRKLIFYFNNWLNYLCHQKNLIIDTNSTTNNMKTAKKNLLAGIKNFLANLIVHQGYIDIKLNHDPYKFKVGTNLASSKGTVIYKNDLIELIEYEPITSNIFQIPMLFIPSCINKYYILDLSNNNSLVKWLMKQGFLVYMISWVNPDLSLANNTFSDYVMSILQAINIITNNIGYNKVHLAGYCMGGTMLTCILSYMQKINDLRISSATHFMSLIDFSNFRNLNTDRLNTLENHINKTGYLDGKLLSMTFNVVHSNELIWPYFINYYLLKKSLSNFDALYWNCDPINLPASMYNFYLRYICVQNKLCQPNTININGINIDPSLVNIPILCVAGEQDHISPWEAAYKSLSIYKNSTNKAFLLANGGHISGLVSPQHSKNCSYKYLSKQINDFIANDPNDWLKQTSKYLGSWWPFWTNWLKNIDPTKIKAPKSYSQQTNSVATVPQPAAPGSYIHQKL